MSSSKTYASKISNINLLFALEYFVSITQKKKKYYKRINYILKTQNSYIYITVLSNHRTLNTKIETCLAILLNFQETKHFTNFTSRTNGISTSYFTLILVVWHSRVVSHYFYESIRLFFYPQDSFTITSLCS